MDYLQRQSRYQRVSGSTTLLAADDLSVTPRSLVAAKTGYTIFIQKIAVAVTTDNAATQVFQDSSGTPVKIAGTKASPGIGPILFDFGPDGTPLTEGKAFQLSNSGAGMAAQIHWEGYRKPTATLTPSTV
jgi:hypothetical protein